MRPHPRSARIVPGSDRRASARSTGLWRPSDITRDYAQGGTDVPPCPHRCARRVIRRYVKWPPGPPAQSRCRAPARRGLCAALRATLASCAPTRCARMGTASSASPRPRASGAQLKKSLDGKTVGGRKHASRNFLKDRPIVSAAIALASPRRLRRNRRHLRRRASGRTLYAYVGDNPLSYYDPYGLWSFSFEAYLGFGGAISFGQDPVTGQFFYGGRLGVGLSVGGSVDPNGKRPGAGQDGNDCGHGTTLGVFDQLSFTAGLVGGNLTQADVGIDLDNSGGGYLDPPAPSDHLVLNRVGFSIGFSAGIEVFGH